MRPIRPVTVVRLAGVAAAAGAVWMTGCLAPVQETTPFPVGAGLGGAVPVKALDAPWTGWDDEAPPLCLFRQVDDWTVLAPPEARIDLSCIRDPFGDLVEVASLKSAGTQTVSSVLLVPRQPVLLPDGADRIEATFGMTATNRLLSGADTPGLAFNLADASGRTFRVDGGRFAAGRRILRNRPLPPEACAPGQQVRLASIEITGWNRPDQNPLVIQAPVAYQEGPAAIVPDWLPGSPVPYRTPVASIIHGDPAQAPAGTATESDQTNTNRSFVAREDGAGFLVSWSGPGGEMAYRFETARWWAGADIRWNGETVGRWEGLRGVETRAAIVVREIRADRVILCHADGLGVTFSGMDGRLVLDLEGGAVRRPAVEAGGLHMEHCEAERVPLIGWAESDELAPRVNRWAWGPRRLLFGSVLLDPSVSHASGQNRDAAGRGADAFPLEYRALYQPDTRGNRAPMRERVWLSVSSSLLEVLPPSFAGRASRADRAAQSAWVEGSGTNHLWDVAAMATGLRLQPWPSRVTSRPTPPLFLNDETIDPSHPGWARQVLRRDANGNWMEGDRPGDYRIHLPFLVLWQNHLAQQKDWTPPASQWAGLLEQAPWAFTDYDARTTGAARFATPRQALARLCAQQGWPAERQAVVVGPLRTGWLYAGLADAVAMEAHAADLMNAFVPAYPIQLRATSAVIGPRLKPDATDAEFDTWLATTLGCGAAPRLDSDGGAGLALRALLLTGPWQARVARARVERMGYEQDGIIVNVDVAMAGGGWKRGRHYLRYAGGYELWVNGGRDAWPVQVGATRHILPPMGWIASGSGFSAGVTRIAGRRVGFVNAPGYLYREGGGDAVLQSELPVALARHPDGRDVSIIYPTGSGPVRLAYDSGFWPAGAVLRGDGAGASGNTTGPVVITSDERGWRMDLPPLTYVANLRETGEPPSP